MNDKLKIPLFLCVGVAVCASIAIVMNVRDDVSSTVWIARVVALMVLGITIVLAADAVIDRIEKSGRTAPADAK
jgi:hypothetical protein